MSSPRTPIQPTACIIRAGKIGDYLLNEHHAVGAAKARFFLSFGYSPARSEILAASLLDHVRPEYFVGESLTPDGKRKLVYEGAVKTPDGRSPWIRTVWQINAVGEAVLITAVPMRERLGTA